MRLGRLGVLCDTHDKLVAAGQSFGRFGDIEKLLGQLYPIYTV